MAFTKIGFGVWKTTKPFPTSRIFSPYLVFEQGEEMDCIELLHLVKARVSRPALVWFVL